MPFIVTECIRTQTKKKNGNETRLKRKGRKCRGGQDKKTEEQLKRKMDEITCENYDKGKDEMRIQQTIKRRGGGDKKKETRKTKGMERSRRNTKRSNKGKKRAA